MHIPSSQIFSYRSSLILSPHILSSFKVVFSQIAYYEISPLSRSAFEILVLGCYAAYVIYDRLSGQLMGPIVKIQEL
jgi:hypothetical protein